jgi:hypothetical protein
VWKISSPTRIRSPDRPARSESLYRLSYRGPVIVLVRIVSLVQTVRVCRGCWPWVAASEGDDRPEWQMLISLIFYKHFYRDCLKLYYLLVKLANTGCELSIRFNELRAQDLTVDR